MTITTQKKDAALTISLEGRLDTTTAPELEAELKKSLGDAQTLTFDLKELEYLSSAGLRVILAAHKQMSKLGGLVVKNANETIMEVFEVTGFNEILTIE